jgi:glycosyltransferase involved in cell wall biosynthesis
MIYVVDDNEKSKKLDRNWLKKYYPNVKIINGSQNGVAAARNLGVKAGKNELISFIDSDDYINESFVEIQRRFHRNFTSVAATGTWIQAFGKDSTIYPQWDNWPILGMLYCLPPAGVLMWKRKTLQSLGFFDEFFKSGFEDYDLTARCSAKKVPIVVLDKVMYMYRRGQESLSQSWTPEMETNLYLEVQSRNIKFLDTTELRIYLKNLKRIGQRLPKWPVDLNSPKIVYNDYTFLFDILLNKYRRNRQVRNGYNSLWTQVKYIMLESFHLFTMVIDYLYYRKKWTIFKGLYSDQSKVVKTAKP